MSPTSTRINHCLKCKFSNTPNSPWPSLVLTACGAVWCRADWNLSWLHRLAGNDVATINTSAIFNKLSTRPTANPMDWMPKTEIRSALVPICINMIQYDSFTGAWILQTGCQMGWVLRNPLRQLEMFQSVIHLNQCKGSTWDLRGSH